VGGLVLEADGNEESVVRVVELGEFGGSVRMVERPEPQPGAGQVRVRVQAATVNPVDWLTASGVLAGMASHLPMPLVLGWDVAGEIAAVGGGTPFEVGQQVAAMSPWFERGVGTFADAVVLEAGWVAPLPAGVDPVLAATVPLNGQTARQAVDLLAVAPGQHLLVTGAGGGVGGFAVQMASAAGARVTAVASDANADRVRALGAAQVLPRSDDLVSAVRGRRPEGFDAVLDAVPVGPQLIGAVRDGGTFVTVLDPAIPAVERGVRVDKVSVTPRPEQLAQLLEDLAAGRLVTSVAQQVPLADAPKAFELAAGGGLRGKVVLVP
jgi:NADPH:quinone reductase